MEVKKKPEYEMSDYTQENVLLHTISLKQCGVARQTNRCKQSSKQPKHIAIVLAMIMNRFAILHAHTHTHISYLPI